jgi:hypothetical protein
MKNILACFIFLFLLPYVAWADEVEDDSSSEASDGIEFDPAAKEILPSASANDGELHFALHLLQQKLTFELTPTDVVNSMLTQRVSLENSEDGDLSYELSFENHDRNMNELGYQIYSLDVDYSAELSKKDSLDMSMGTRWALGNVPWYDLSALGAFSEVRDNVQSSSTIKWQHEFNSKLTGFIFSGLGTLTEHPHEFLKSELFSLTGIGVRIASQVRMTVSTVGSEVGVSLGFRHSF